MGYVVLNSGSRRGPRAYFRRERGRGIGDFLKSAISKGKDAVVKTAKKIAHSDILKKAKEHVANVAKETAKQAVNAGKEIAKETGKELLTHAVVAGSQVLSDVAQG